MSEAFSFRARVIDLTTGQVNDLGDVHVETSHREVVDFPIGHHLIDFDGIHPASRDIWSGINVFKTAGQEGIVRVQEWRRRVESGRLARGDFGETPPKVFDLSGMQKGDERELIVKYEKGLIGQIFNKGRILEIVAEKRSV